MQERLALLLKQRRLQQELVKAVLQEYHDNIGDMDGPEEKERRRGKIQKLISSM
jgi:beta-catenin-like protein 1